MQQIRLQQIIVETKEGATKFKTGRIEEFPLFHNLGGSIC